MELKPGSALSHAQGSSSHTPYQQECPLALYPIAHRGPEPVEILKGWTKPVFVKGPGIHFS